MTQTIKKTDAELKTDVLSELEYEPSIKVPDIGVLVKDGTVTLNGNVVRLLSGVKGVSNLISIKPKLTAAAVESDIKAAFKLNSLLDANKIHVETIGGKVILRGNVRNFAELDEAERVA